MPPQPGVFALPYASTHKSRAANTSGAPGDHDMNTTYHHQQSQGHHHAHHGAGSSRSHVSLDDAKKEKKRKEIAGKLGKEMSERRDDGRHYAESISALHGTAMQLSARPYADSMYTLRLYPLSLERSALLAQLACEEKHAVDCAQNAYDEERERVEEEWKRGRERVRERLMEGIEERRRRAREEKEGEGTAGGESEINPHRQSRPHITRKLRNKLGTSPPPTPLGMPFSANVTHGLGSTTPLTATIAFTNPHSLSIDELPSPFPLPLTSMTLPSSAGGTGGAMGGGAAGNGGRRRAKASGFHVSQAGVGGLGKSLGMLCPSKEAEIESDIGEIRRGSKRRRATAVTLTKA